MNVWQPRSAKVGPLVAVVIATLVVSNGRLDQSNAVKIVGAIPFGLPVSNGAGYQLASDTCIGTVGIYHYASRIFGKHLRGESSGKSKTRKS